MPSNYFLVIIQNDSTSAVYGYDNKDDALVLFHNELAYRAEGRNSTLCVILDKIGGTIKREKWERAIIPEQQEGDE